MALSRPDRVAGLRREGIRIAGPELPISPTTEAGTRSGPAASGYDRPPMAVAEVSRTPSRASRLRPSYGWSLGAIIAVALVAWYVVLRRGSWAYDDNMWMEAARQYGFTWHWVASDLFGHWIPGYTATYSLLDQLMPIDYRWALVAMLVALGVAMLLFARTIELLVGRGPAPLLAAVYLGVSVLLIRALEWTAQGFQTVPTLLFDLLCLWAYVRYLSEPRRRWIVVSAGAVAAGLMFYEKPFFMPFYLLVLRALVLEVNPRPGAVIKAIWRERMMWIAYAAVLAIYVAVREAVGAGSTGAGPLPTLGALGHALWLMWVKSLVPALFGFALPSSHVNTFQLVWGGALQVFVVGIVTISIWRKRSAWRPWVALAIFVLATWLLVGVTRVGIQGPETATDQRYLQDFAWLAPLLVCLAFSRRASFMPKAADPMQPSNRRPGRLLLVLTAVVALGYMSSSVATAANWEDGWGGVAARAWEKNLQHGLAALQRSGTRLTVADNFVPLYIVDTSFVPYSYLSLVLPNYGGHASANGPIVGQLIGVDPTGVVHRAHVARVWATFKLPRQCGTGTAPFSIERRISRTLDPAAGPYYARISYWSGGIGHLPLYVDTGAGYPGAPNLLVGVAPGTAQSLAWLGAGAPRGLVLNSPPYVCLRQIEIVTLAFS